MTQKTSRLAITYPSDQQQPFFGDFQQGFVEMDGMHFGSIEGLNTQLYGGGTVTWNGASGSPVNRFSFTSPIVFVSPSSGQVLTWSETESPITIPVGNFLYALLTRGATTAVTLTKSGPSPTIAVSAAVPVLQTVAAQVIAYHAADGRLYFPTGLVIDANSSNNNGLRPSAGGSGSLADEPYLTITNTANLTNERALAVAVADLALADGGAGASATLSLATTPVTPGVYSSADITVDAKGRITSAANGAGLSAEPYLTVGNTGNLSNERAIAVSAGELVGSDGGAGTNYTLGLADTAVSPGSYSQGSFTVDAKGRLTAASGSALVDSRAAPIVTASATGGGGTVEGTITVGATQCVQKYLRVSMLTPGAAQIEYFADSARTDQIYHAPFTGDYDFSAEGDYTDRTPASLLSTDGTTALESNRIHYRFTNNSVSASAFQIYTLLGVL